MLSGNKCFKPVVLNDKERVTFSDAVKTCRKESGFLPDLASVNSEQEQGTQPPTTSTSTHTHTFFTDRFSEECSFRLFLYGKILLGVFVPFGSLWKDSLGSVRSVWFFMERFSWECSFRLVLYGKIL